MKIFTLLFVIIIYLSGCASTKKIEVLYPDISNVEERTKPYEIVHHKGSKYTTYDYFSYIPFSNEKSQKVTLVLTGMNSNACTTDYNVTINETKNVFKNHYNNLITNNVIFLCPIIPSSGNHDVYVVPLDRDVMRKEQGWLNRPDLKTIKIIEEFKLVLKEAGYDVDDKVVLEGFSAGSIFSYNFTMIHPEMVKATIVGGPSYLTLPVEEILNKYAYWPIGIQNYKNLFGYDFNYEKFKKVPIYVYWGDSDRVNSLIYPNNNTDMFYQEEKNIIIERFGLEDPERLESICKYIKSLGNNIEYKIYPNMKHLMNSQSKVDIKRFLIKIIN